MLRKTYAINLMKDMWIWENKKKYDIIKNIIKKEWRENV